MEFYKLVASGNDFILVEARKMKRLGLSYRRLAKEVCRRKFGIGADGLLVIEPSKKALFKMRIFNPDGTEAEMCGNGARCTSLWAKLKLKTENSISFETKAGVIHTKVSSINSQASRKKPQAQIKIKMVKPFDLKLGLPIKILGRKIKVNYINTGVPHTVVFVEGLDKIDVEGIGRPIRFHRRFSPAGANVDFVEVLAKDYIKIRTYERGLEGESLACGTGAVAGAIITSYCLSTTNHQFRVRVLTKSGEVLKVYFFKEKDKISNLWLEGKAYLVYKGEFLKGG